MSLSDSKSHQVSRTLLSILTDPDNGVVWMVSARLLISKSSYLCSNPLVTVPSAPITIGIMIIFLFRDFFQFTSKVLVLISLLFTFFQFYPAVSQNGKVYNSGVSLFCWLSLGLVVWRRLDDLKIPKNFVCLILQDGFWVKHLLFVRMVKFQFLAQSQWITFLTQSCSVFTEPLASWVECLSMVRETGVQSQVESYKRLKNGTWCHLV